MLFCSSEACFTSFGNPAVSGFYFWGLGTIAINGKGWHDYVLRHELIHHWQAERFGPLKASRMPRWYIEGMAYSLSQDPRIPLPRTDIQAWREQFDDWVIRGNDWRRAPE